MGNYDIIGDVYPNVITLRSEDWYLTNNKRFQDANINVLDSINGKVDFKRYDNWGFNTGTNSFVFNPRNGDGYLDMMYIIYRTPNLDKPEPKREMIDYICDKKEFTWKQLFRDIQKKSKVS